MDPKNDVQVSVPQTEQLTQSGSLTLPPIELEKPVTKIQRKKRKRFRRRRSKKISPNDGSLDSSSYILPEPMPAFWPVFSTFMIMHSIGFMVLFLVLWYYQHCSSEEGTLSSFDNMVAYTIHIVGIGCVVFSTEVQTTSPYNVIYPCITTSSMAYLMAKVGCNRELIVIFETSVIFGIECITVYTIAVHSNKDFTPLTPVLIAAYTGTTILNVGVIYLVGESVPVIMLSIISLFIAYGLFLCTMQFPITHDPRYRLPSNKRILGALMMHYTSLSLSYHTYLIAVAFFDVYGTKKFQYYTVNLTFYLEQ